MISSIICSLDISVLFIDVFPFLSTRMTNYANWVNNGAVVMDSAIWGFIGVCVGALSSAAVAYVIERQKTKRILQIQLMRIGFEQWKEFFEPIKKDSEKGLNLATPDVFVISMATLLPIIERLDTQPVEQLMPELHVRLEKIKLILDMYTKEASKMSL